MSAPLPLLRASSKREAIAELQRTGHKVALVSRLSTARVLGKAYRASTAGGRLEKVDVSIAGGLGIYVRNDDAVNAVTLTVIYVIEDVEFVDPTTTAIAALAAVRRRVDCECDAVILQLTAGVDNTGPVAVAVGLSD
jgi:hypothetical protein